MQGGASTQGPGKPLHGGKGEQVLGSGRVWSGVFSAQLAHKRVEPLKGGSLLRIIHMLLGDFALFGWVIGWKGNISPAPSKLVPSRGSLG